MISYLYFVIKSDYVMRTRYRFGHWSKTSQPGGYLLVGPGNQAVGVVLSRPRGGWPSISPVLQNLRRREPFADPTQISD